MVQPVSSFDQDLSQSFVSQGGAKADMVPRYPLRWADARVCRSAAAGPSPCAAPAAAKLLRAVRRSDSTVCRPRRPARARAGRAGSSHRSHRRHESARVLSASLVAPSGAPDRPGSLVWSGMGLLLAVRRCMVLGQGRRPGNRPPCLSGPILRITASRRFACLSRWYSQCCVTTTDCRPFYGIPVSSTSRATLSSR